jgi:hypothetical protein
VNDWAASPSGKLLHVTQVPKLAQQALKYVLASKNPFNQSIVCHLKDHLHKKFNAVVSTQDIASEVTRVLQVYKQVQSAQRTVQNMDALEMLRDIKTVSAQRDVTDPTLLYVSIQVTPYGQTQPIPMNLALKAAN